MSTHGLQVECVKMYFNEQRKLEGEIPKSEIVLHSAVTEKGATQQLTPALFLLVVTQWCFWFDFFFFFVLLL